MPINDRTGAELKINPDGSINVSTPPGGATPIVVSVTSAGAFSASLPAVAGKVNYISGFSISSNGATAAGNTSVTVGPLIGATQLVYQMPENAIGVPSPSTNLTQNFSPALPGNGANAAISVTTGAAAGNTQTIINVWGYQL